jgi:APA family basic amino acid/polyamine antiporter
LRALQAEPSGTPVPPTPGFIRGLGLLDCVMIVAGSMIGSGIFIVPADIARRMGSAGWMLLVWVAATSVIVCAALSYGELAAMMPQVGGQYVYLREIYSPLAGFLFGWSMFLVIQSGTIAAVAVGFARFLGVLVPAVSPATFLVPPLVLSHDYALSLSVQQAVAIGLIALLTYLNSRGLKTGKLIQNVFTSAKTLALVALILLGLTLGRNAGAMAENFRAPWTPRAVETVQLGQGLVPDAAADRGGVSLGAAFVLAMVGALFSCGAWNDVSFAGAEIKNPSRTLPRAMIVGTVAVGILYLLANLTYLVTLPLPALAHAPDDRVATAVMATMFGAPGGTAMAVAIVLSTFGCANGLILSAARIYYAMARDGLFFRAAGRLNAARVPAVGLALQGVWAALLVLPRTRLYDPLGRPLLDAAGLPRYGSLYGNLLEYVIFAILLFYVLTISGLFVLRQRRPEAPRPYRTWGYPLVPGYFLLGASAVMAGLFLYRRETTWPGLVIVLAGIPVYFLWRRLGAPPSNV